MNRNIYALLVGIDEYVGPVSPLQGCVNDIIAIKESHYSPLTVPPKECRNCQQL
jgi:hypothetical protein